MPEFNCADLTPRAMATRIVSIFLMAAAIAAMVVFFYQTINVPETGTDVAKTAQKAVSISLGVGTLLYSLRNFGKVGGDAMFLKWNKEQVVWFLMALLAVATIIFGRYSSSSNLMAGISLGCSILGVVMFSMSFFLKVAGKTGPVTPAQVDPAAGNITDDALVSTTSESDVTKSDQVDEYEANSSDDEKELKEAGLRNVSKIVVDKKRGRPAQAQSECKDNTESASQQSSNGFSEMIHERNKSMTVPAENDVSSHVGLAEYSSKYMEGRPHNGEKSIFRDTLSRKDFAPSLKYMTKGYGNFYGHGDTNSTTESSSSEESYMAAINNHPKSIGGSLTRASALMVSDAESHPEQPDDVSSDWDFMSGSDLESEFRRRLLQGTRLLKMFQ